MPNIIQIEELVYGRLPQVSKADWIAMLTEHGAHADYTTFKNDYLLLEQSDYRFADGKMISSERIVYNIDYLTYDTERNAPDPDNTTEKVTTRYEASTDRYFVYYTHYPSSENDIPLADIPLADIPLADILSEADMPITGTFHRRNSLYLFLPQNHQPQTQKRYNPPQHQLRNTISRGDRNALRN